jgi:hypothetical protein
LRDVRLSEPERRFVHEQRAAIVDNVACEKPVLKAVPPR